MTLPLSSLLSSIEEVTTFNSCHGYSQLNSILNNYIKALNEVNNYSEDYKRSTNIYFTDISNIRENIQLSLESTSEVEKKVAFENAKRELMSGIQALASLVRNHEWQPEEVLA